MQIYIGKFNLTNLIIHQNQKKMKKIFTLFVAFLALTFCAKAQVTIILEAHDVWEDGSGYQLLLDADHNTYGTIIPESGGLTTSGDAPASVYAEFEYTVPVGADGSLTTQNIVFDGTATITIPAGTYDFCITNPTPGDRMWIAGAGIDPTRADDYVFVDGSIYHFLMMRNGNNDGCQLTVSINPTEPTIAPSPASVNFGSVILGNTANVNVTVNNYLLTAPVTATTTAPFAISSDGTTFGTTATIPAAGGTLSVRYTPTTVGTDNGTITLSSTGAANATITLTGSALDCSNVTIPYSYAFDDESLFECWQVIDANEDGYTFQFADGAAAYPYNSNADADDWLISPNFTFDGNQTVSFDYAVQSASFPEKFQAFALGADNNPIALTDVVTATNTGLETQYLNVSALNGVYAIGIHCVSDADEWYLYITNFNISNVDAAPEVTLEGPSAALLNTPVTFTAVSPTANSFAWTIDGAAVSNNTNTLNHTFTTTGNHTVGVTVTNDFGSSSATKTVNIYTCEGAQSLPYFEGFEDGFGCWSDVDNDGDGFSWTSSIGADGLENYEGNGCMISYSYVNNYGAVNPDNWLVSPALAIPSEGATLSWFVAAQDPNWAAEHYDVMISTTNNISNFVSLFNETLSSGDWEQRSVNIGESWAGQTVHIAFQHHDVTDMFAMKIDNITVTAGVGVENHESYTTIFPNPANNVLNINANSNINRVEVYNMMGQMVGSYNVNDMNTQISTTSFANGVYMVKIATENGTSTKKFTVAR